MELTITARHFKLKEDLRDYVEEKSRKLSRYHDGILDMEVLLGWEKQDRVVDMVINVHNKRIVLKESSEDLRKSFDLALDKAERQLKRHKAKNRAVEKDVINSA